MWPPCDGQGLVRISTFLMHSGEVRREPDLYVCGGIMCPIVCKPQYWVKVAGLTDTIMCVVVPSRYVVGVSIVDDDWDGETRLCVSAEGHLQKQSQPTAERECASICA